MLISPSIQVGCLQAALDGAGILARSHSFHLEFLHFLTSEGAAGESAREDYENVSVGWSNLGVGEWIFAVAPYRPAHAGLDERYQTFLARNGIQNS